MSVRKDAGIAQQSIRFPYIDVDDLAFAVSENGLEALCALFGMTVANRAKPIDLSAFCIDDLEIHPNFAPFRKARRQLVAGSCVVYPQSDPDRFSRINARR